MQKYERSYVVGKKTTKYYATDDWDIMNKVLYVYDEKCKKYERGEKCEFASIKEELEDAGLKKTDITERLRVRRINPEILPKRFPFEEALKYSRFTGISIFEFLRHNSIVHALSTGREDAYMLKQQELGKRWEETIINAYAERGYFAYKIPTMNSGTVFDILVAKRGGVLMIEAKHLDEEKLWYEKSGLKKKRDELDHFVNTTQNNVYIYVDSEITGRWWTTWVKAKPIFEKQGYITKKDCAPLSLNNINWEDGESE